MSLKCSSDDEEDHVKDCAHNFEDVSEDSFGEEYDNEWDFQRELDDLDSSDYVSSRSSYIQGLVNQSALHLLQPLRAKKALEGPYKELGLFFLFLTQTYLETVRNWTNERMIRKGLAEITKEQLLAYLGLEMGTSLLRMNEIKEYWSTGPFMGNETFKNSMTRKRFIDIRTHITFRAPKEQERDLQGQQDDPLWHSRSFMEHFARNSASIAVPTGTSALDENTARTKARTRARTYMPNKSDKYGVRFYSVVGTKHCYLSSINDNRAGNETDVPGAADFCRLFGELRTPFKKFVVDAKPCRIDPSSSSALWILQMALQAKRHCDPSGRRVFFTDNFYTRHNLAISLKAITDGECRLVGTVKFTNVDSTNRYYLFKAIEQLKNSPRGSWLLVRAYNKDPNYENWRGSTKVQTRNFQKSNGLRGCHQWMTLQRNAVILSSKTVTLLSFIQVILQARPKGR